jgi:hypothetical protein
MALRTISKCLLRSRVHVVPLLHKHLVKLFWAQIVVVGFKFLQTKEVVVGVGNLLFGRRSCRDRGAGNTEAPCEVGV